MVTRNRFGLSPWVYTEKLIIYSYLKVNEYV
jgi:hypothetical protein